MLTRHVAGRVYNYDHCIGRYGISGPSLAQPMDFALGPNRTLYVVNRGHEFLPSQGITKCTLDSEFLSEDRGPGFGAGQSPWPISVALDSQENVYISDDYASRIFIYDKDGESLGGWGTKGSGDGELNGPSGIEFDQNDNLYIVDALNNRVQVFTKDGKFLSTWGSPGCGEAQFDMPWGIAIDNNGHVYVADWNNDRVQKFTAEGRYLTTFGTPGMGDGELRRPSNIAIDSEGDVYIIDWGNKRLNIYTPFGDFLTSFMGDADRLPKWGQEQVDANPDVQKARRRADLTREQLFRRPVAVNVDDEGRIMVLETLAARIQIYVKEKDFVDAPFNL